MNSINKNKGWFGICVVFIFLKFTFPLLPIRANLEVCFLKFHIYLYFYPVGLIQTGF